MRDTDFSLVDGLRVPLLSGILTERAQRSGTRPVMLIVTATGRDADAVRGDIETVMPTAEILEFPAWETLPHERLSPSPETVGRRIHALRRLAEVGAGPEAGEPLVVIASVRAALQPVADNLVDIDPVELVPGSRGNDLDAIAGRLVDLSYARVDMVTRRGEFAVRGGILDVFSPLAEHPVRVDFFGDEIEEMRAFSVADQRSLAPITEPIVLPPSREILLTEEVMRRAGEMQSEFPNIAQMLEKIAGGIAVEGMESLAPALADRLVPITHYLPELAAIAVLSPERVVNRAMSLAETNREFLQAAWSAATAGAEAPIDLDAGDFLTLRALRESKGDRTWFTLSPFQASDIPLEDLDVDEVLTVRIDADAAPNFSGNADGAIEHVRELVAAGWAVVVTAQGAGTAERAFAVLRESGIPADEVDETAGALPEGRALVTLGQIESGFESEEAKIAVLSESDFFGRQAGYDTRRPKKLAARRKSVVDPMQLKTGDFVVHETHGIGRFIELTERQVGGAKGQPKTTREYLVLEYAPSKRGYPGDRLYVPTDQLDLLSRYVGGDAPTLSKMGGSDWAQAKGKARKAVRDIAVELVKLYGARMASRGHAFSPDTPWQRELEEAFPYIETPDQLQTINEVKADMEREIPMDRLLSGDVGFGKTEVAVRATFKAVQDGKQVVILVPTTLLVRQHLETFTSRFAGFPVQVRALSRFQSAKESRETLEGLKAGTVDVVIGTHRILSDKAEFKDLGLVIIDEEQRFGVEHKDQLKKLKTNVDVLAMSATPIPRTLEMAVTGIREMSTLATPPEDRHPILTFVGPYSDKQVAAAIRRELLREGQVFFVHNRVSSIQATANRLAELVPEARIAVAHGKLSEHELERVIVDFWERRFDVLVTTTIVETGLDIANANTLIVDRADKYGLSQLHQLRGRVGRSRERAYAYFLYDGDKPLSETATDRLETIAANNELGAGMQVALKDLEIRGAGNLLGGEQAGHIAGVGFDLYLRMIGEAVDTFRGEEKKGPTELRLELPVDARIPDTYIESERLRLEAYQKLSAASTANAKAGSIDLVVEELQDRYGELPIEVENLVAVARLRQMAALAELSEVVTMGSNLRIAPAHLADSAEVRLKRLYPSAKHFQQASAVSVPLPTRDDLEGAQLARRAQGRADADASLDALLIAWVRELLESIFGAKEPQPDAE